jgi:hypothetical protein
MTSDTGAPTDVVGGMPATTDRGATSPDVSLDARELATFAAVADRLIPEAKGMPSAAAVVTPDRVAWVLRSRPDLAAPLRLALRPQLGDDVHARLEALATEPTSLAALQLAIVAGYYTDNGVRERIGYPGQVALSIRSWELPTYLEEGLIDAVLARGPKWRDPATGRRAIVPNAPTTYAERFAGPPEGADDGHERA